MDKKDRHYLAVGVNPERTVDRVREFHKKFGHPVSVFPTTASEAIRELRVRLIAEELVELCEALGIVLQIETGELGSNISVESLTDGRDIDLDGCHLDLVGAADALGDLDYVVQGANVVFGFPAEAIAREIHRSNMSKLGEDGEPIYREDGKIQKGPNYTEPDLQTIVLQACAMANNLEERSHISAREVDNRLMGITTDMSGHQIRRAIFATEKEDDQTFCADPLAMSGVRDDGKIRPVSTPGNDMDALTAHKLAVAHAQIDKEKELALRLQVKEAELKTEDAMETDAPDYERDNNG